jgi:Raf kinase inhibitor-like YbhB/YbcL family protein
MSIGWSFALGRLVPAALAFALSGAGSAGAADAVAFTLTSPAFSAGGTIPAVAANTDCVPNAENRSPQLDWKGAPAGTKGFALTLFDPDAPTGHGFFHWVLFNIPPTATRLPAGAGDPSSHAAIAGTAAGSVDFGFSHYGGPCPPRGDRPHHYVFTLYALDEAKLGGDDRMTGAQLEIAVRGHVVAKATLTGRFGR